MIPEKPGKQEAMQIVLPLAMLAIAVTALLPLSRVRAQIAAEREAESGLTAIMELMSDRLCLIESQQRLVRPVLEDHLTERRRIFDQVSVSGSCVPLRSQLRQLDRVTESKLVKILTTVQMQDYRKLCRELERDDELSHGAYGADPCLPPLDSTE